MAVGAGTARDGQSPGNSTPKCGPDLRSVLSPNCLLLSPFKGLLKNDTHLLLVIILAGTSSMGGVVGGAGKNLALGDEAWDPSLALGQPAL